MKAANSAVQAFVDDAAEPAVQGFLHRPATPSGDGLVLTHGAGGNANMALLVALAETFADAGFFVARCNLPFRQRRPHGPPSPASAASDREGLRNAVATLRRFATGRIFLGGQSYGGRQASILCADDPTLVAGLILLSYPLHPPGKPDQLRIAHLPKLQVPTLFVEGTSDPFATIPEIQLAMKLIPAKHELLEVEGAGHDLGFKAKSQKTDLPTKAFSTFQSLFFGNSPT